MLMLERKLNKWLKKKVFTDYSIGTEDLVSLKTIQYNIEYEILRNVTLLDKGDINGNFWC